MKNKLIIGLLLLVAASAFAEDRSSNNQLVKQLEQTKRALLRQVENIENTLDGITRDVHVIHELSHLYYVNNGGPKVSVWGTVSGADVVQGEYVELLYNGETIGEAKTTFESGKIIYKLRISGNPRRDLTSGLQVRVYTADGRSKLFDVACTVSGSRLSEYCGKEN